MVRPNIVNYIQNNLAKGFSIHEIKHGLLAQGISDSEIDEAIRLIRRPSNINLSHPKRVEFHRQTNYRGLKIFFGILFIFLFIFLFLFFLIKAERPLKSEFTISEYNLLGGINLELVEGSTVNMDFNLENYIFNIKEVGENSATLSGDIISEISLGDKKYFDLNRDYVDDLIIKIENLEKSEVFIFIQLIDNSECEEDWVCSKFSSCINGVEKRVCLDVNYCETENNKPELEEICEEELQNIPNITLFPKIVNCSGFTLPDCGNAYPNNVSNIQRILDGELLTFPDFDEDCSLVCFGKNLLDSCDIANVSLKDGFGSSELFQSLGVKDGRCGLRYEVIDENPDEPGSQGLYLNCPIPLEDIYGMSCIGDACLDFGMPGQTTMGVLTSMVIDSIFNAETECNGTMIDYLMSS